MLARLGNVLFWTGIIIAAAWVSLIWSLGGTAVLVNFGIDTPGGQAATYVIPAALAVGIGWALKYILAGPGRRDGLVLGLIVETAATMSGAAALMAIAYVVISAIRHTGDPLAGLSASVVSTLVYWGLSELSFRF
jgi:hypothetical protein